MRPRPVRFVDVDHAGERADRARHEAVDARDLARLAGELDRGGVDRLDDLARVEAVELGPGGGERGGLDQLGAGLQVGEVDGEDVAAGARAAPGRGGRRPAGGPAAPTPSRRPPRRCGPRTGRAPSGEPSRHCSGRRRSPWTASRRLSLRGASERSRHPIVAAARSGLAMTDTRECALHRRLRVAGTTPGTSRRGGGRRPRRRWPRGPS